MGLKQLKLDEDDNPERVAIIIKGNPKYINDPKIKAIANSFYAEIKTILVDNGFKVEFDVGAAYTRPRVGAMVWIGHSRGVDRFQYAEEGVITVPLQTLDHGKKYNSPDEQGRDPDHYKLSPKDKKILSDLK